MNTPTRVPMASPSPRHGGMCWGGRLCICPPEGCPGLTPLWDTSRQPCCPFPSGSVIPFLSPRGFFAGWPQAPDAARESNCSQNISVCLGVTHYRAISAMLCWFASPGAGVLLGPVMYACSMCIYLPFVLLYTF